MTYPTNSSIIDMRSKINRPSITKTTLILKELDKLTSQSAVKPQRRSLFANQSFGGSSSSSKRLSFSSPTTLLHQQERRRSQLPRWSRQSNLFEQSMMSDSDEQNKFAGDVELNNNDSNTNSLSHSYIVNFTRQKQTPTNDDILFMESNTTTTIKELENVSPIAFDAPLKPGFLTQELQNAFEFELPEHRGPKSPPKSLFKLTNDKISDTTLVIDE